jgi:DNA ligase-1
MLVKNKSELLCLYYAALDNKFEGLMARNSAGVYATSTESKTTKNRSVDLQKLKPWYDEEFEIVNFTSGKGRNQNAIIWVCKTKSGNEFNCDPKNMTIEVRKQLYADLIAHKNKFEDEYKGLMMTVQYEEKNNESGIPQRAKALGIRDFG